MRPGTRTKKQRKRQNGLRFWSSTTHLRLHSTTTSTVSRRSIWLFYFYIKRLLLESSEGKSSKAGSWRQTSSIHSTASSSNTWGGLYQSPFDQESQNYVPPQQSYTQQYYALAQDYGSQNYGVSAKDFDHRRRLDMRYSRIADNFNSLKQVTEALARAGLESSNLIVGIDFTKSNEWTGAKSFQKRSLHHIGGGLNPYEQAISIIGKTLSACDEDNLIPCFGFGDASTHDRDVFSFYPDERFCNGFEEVLRRYREIVPKLRLAGPTSFAPVIEMAMTIVEQSGGQYHVLVIIADGQVFCILYECYHNHVS
ncbi:hypothetical protein ACB092_11G159300 [Castanea dentata]